MNKERLEMLAAPLEMLPREQFDMMNWCGTACCIAGHTLALAGKAGERLLRDRGFSGGAAHWLKLPRHIYEDLFTPSDLGGNASYEDVTPTAAASVVRHLKDTGVVAWEKYL